MVKVAFQMIAFQSDYVLEATLEALRSYGPVIASQGPVQYWRERGYKRSTDRTTAILQTDRNVDLVSGMWKEKDEMMRSLEWRIPEGTTHVWMVDADEVWKASSIENTFKLLDRYDSVAFKPYTFYGGFDRYLTGFEEKAEWIRIQRWYAGAHWHSHRPPTVLHPDGKPMRKHRHLDSPERFYHYSYVFPTQVQNKIEYYTSWGAGVIPNYFERVYLRWVNSTPTGRGNVEREFQGVHEWLPARRGECFTKAFEGRHPDGVIRRMPDYNARLYRELRELDRKKELA